jgi:predicted transposase/invertase (TIGR01784 family)
MVDPQKAASILYKHFEQLTSEQFLKNLERACPEVFEEEQDRTKSSFIKETKVYQEAFEEGKEQEKLEILSKLLQKGLSIQEVADLLELDPDLVRQAVEQQ